MPVGSTQRRSVQVPGFDVPSRLTPTPRLIRFLFVKPALCSQLPPDPTSRRRRCCSANISPCRVCKGLSPSSECALPGAQGLLGATRLAPSGPTFGCWENRWLRVHATTGQRETRINVRTLRSLSLSYVG